MFEQLKSGFKRTIDCNKYQPKRQSQSPYFGYLIEPSVQGINTLFMLLFENNERRTSYKKYFLPTSETKFTMSR